MREPEKNAQADAEENTIAANSSGILSCGPSPKCRIELFTGRCLRFISSRFHRSQSLKQSRLGFVGRNLSDVGAGDFRGLFAITSCGDIFGYTGRCANLIS